MRRPHSHPEQLEVEQVCAIVRLKQAHPFWGAVSLPSCIDAGMDKLSAKAAFKRILERSGLVDKRKVAVPLPAVSRCGV